MADRTQDEQKAERLRAALRENLRRRKQSARAPEAKRDKPAKPD
jgi:hypothetical protein